MAGLRLNAKSQIIKNFFSKALDKPRVKAYTLHKPINPVEIAGKLCFNF
jgi:hypothetical protein